MLNSSIHIRSRSSTAGLLAGAPVTKAWLMSLVTAALSVNIFNLHRYLPPLRALERIFGSHKYFSFLLVSLLTTQAMGYICRFWLHVPSHMFFSIHLPWFNNSSGTNGRGVVRVGDKWMVCGWFAYFAYKVGLAAGFVFEADVGGLRNWRAPRWSLWADKNDGSRNQSRGGIGVALGMGGWIAMAQQG
ncbi:hypothetical protein BX661DRAFT_177820 [Kickxella alabastrina]|uniref:uncharacterized protein n=1 Tax=Kickxella alabastrina TaxID=61397 RepID=UPI00221EB336|nr:uncharacterized protein BX661DRAFT_177820 [Kickxella alabastrina]KAI7833924.1 hypothetical protein BX661DRAFT_177820 [Kickxella alabastrina]